MISSSSDLLTSSVSFVTENFSVNNWLITIIYIITMQAVIEDETQILKPDLYNKMTAYLFYRFKHIVCRGLQTSHFYLRNMLFHLT